jgi:hypothetical protein
MKNNIIKHQTIQFIVMVIIGILFNPMSMLAFDINHLYSSLTLFYGGLLMASNMMWAHEIIHYVSMGHFNKNVFFIGIFLSLFIIFFILREQLFVNEEQWLRRMIPHHSTALTTTNKLIKRMKDLKNTPQLYKLTKDIVYNQEREIIQMKLMLNKYL